MVDQLDTNSGTPAAPDAESSFEARLKAAGETAEKYGYYWPVPPSM